MANLSVTTINKFLRESYSAETKPLKASKKAQFALLEAFADKINHAADLHCDGLDQEWLDGSYQKIPRISISVLALLSSNQYQDDKGSFKLGFKDGDELMVWTSTWRSRSAKVVFPLSDLEDVDIVIQKIRERIKVNKVKSQKKSTTENFSAQNFEIESSPVIEKAKL